jgi:hypothetical protein
MMVKDPIAPWALLQGFARGLPRLWIPPGGQFKADLKVTVIAAK